MIKILVCFYSCNKDENYLNTLFKTELFQYIKYNEGYDWTVVLAREDISYSRLKGRKLLLKCIEEYTNLSIKTFKMFEFLSQFDYDHIIKIDSTIVNYGHKKHNRNVNHIRQYSSENILKHISSLSFYDYDYNGIISQKANKEGFNKWLEVKQIAGNYSLVFKNNEPTPLYFLGKCYSASNRFVKFIAKYGRDVALEHKMYLGGSEDMMIGRLFSMWENSDKRSPIH